MQDKKLEARINFWKFGITGCALILIVAYILYFGFHLDQPVAENADKWGQFGDFVGGLLNPLVAFAAFYWLTQSVKLQKLELTETRKALQDSAVSQREQAKQSEISTQIGAMTTVINALQQQISFLQKSEALLETEIVQLKKTISEKENESSGTINRIDQLEKNYSKNLKQIKDDAVHKFRNAQIDISNNRSKIERLIEERDEYLDDLRALLRINPENP